MPCAFLFLVFVHRHILEMAFLMSLAGITRYPAATDSVFALRYLSTNFENVSWYPKSKPNCEKV
jgi:hypothetical protein